MPTRAIILAGGRGSRLHPITLEVPKPLITVKKKPLVNYSIELFAQYGIKHMAIVIRNTDRLDYERWKLAYAKELAGLTIDLFEESEPMGTLGYIARHLKDWMNDESVFVTNADDIKDVDLPGMVAFQQKVGALATLALTKVENPNDYGVAVLKNGTIERFVEKSDNPPSDLISIGVYLVHPKALLEVAPAIAAGTKYLMFEKDLFPALAAKATLGGFNHEGTYIDCGTLAKWERVVSES